MKKKEAVKQLETIVDAADRVSVDIVVDGKGMDADPIVAGMMAGMMYAAALLEDEDGNEFELEQLATMEFNGNEYSAFLPADMAEDDPDYGYIILRIEEENGEELFCSVDDEEELVAVYDRFMELLFDEETDEDPEE